MLTPRTSQCGETAFVLGGTEPAEAVAKDLGGLDQDRAAKAKEATDHQSCPWMKVKRQAAMRLVNELVAGQRVASMSNTEGTVWTPHERPTSASLGPSTQTSITRSFKLHATDSQFRLTMEIFVA